ncbi:MAG: hypothetical protein ABJG15_01415 [Hyphomonadaceae bacterium]
MRQSPPNRSHVLLTLGTLFAFGGASRFLPAGLAAAEEAAVPAATTAQHDALPADSEEAAQSETEAVPALPSSPSAEEVCLTGEAADKFSEDVWLFEAERETMRQEQIKLQLWEAELNAQTVELQDLQLTLEARWSEMQEQASQDIIHLAKMYSSMKAEQAAEIFNQMDPDFAAGFLTQLPSEQAGLILANMEKRKAYIVSLSVAAETADIRADE